MCGQYFPHLPWGSINLVIEIQYMELKGDEIGNGKDESEHFLPLVGISLSKRWS